jgi:hypothetical protein
MKACEKITEGRRFAVSGLRRNLKPEKSKEDS